MRFMSFLLRIWENSITIPNLWGICEKSKPREPLGEFVRIGRSNRPEMFCKKSAPTNFIKFTGKHLYGAGVSFLIQKTIFFKKNKLTQVFFCQFWKISKNTFSCRILPVAASKLIWNYWHQKKYSKL